MKERAELDARLIQWLTQVQELDDGLLFRSQYDILSVSQRTTLVRTPIEDLKTPENITTLLGESDEWGSEFASKLFQLIHMYDASLPKKKTRSRRDAPAKK